MAYSLTSILGVVMLVLAVASTYSMFHMWGYPFDKVARKTACPRWKLNIHRSIGYSYLVVYLVLMWHMVPRLWHYQIEFPPRTVVHIVLGMSIGIILVIKISILRWFRHLEEWMPYLGVAMLFCTVVLLGLSLPFAVRAGGGDGTFTPANRGRVRELLATAGFPADVKLDRLSTERSLGQGRQILLEKCTFCHDLKTAIARPRTPEDWLGTVDRMAQKPTLGPRLDRSEIHKVSAYLIAITPALQSSAKIKRKGEEAHRESMEALEEIERGEASGDAGTGAAAARAGDAGERKRAFERVCSQCHDASDTDEAAPRSRGAVDALIERMIGNGLEASKPDLALVRGYLIETYVK